MRSPVHDGIRSTAAPAAARDHTPTCSKCFGNTSVPGLHFKAASGPSLVPREGPATKLNSASWMQDITEMQEHQWD